MHLELIHCDQEIVIGNNLALYFPNRSKELLPHFEDLLWQFFPILFGLVRLNNKSPCLVAPCIDAIHQLIELLPEGLVLLLQFQELFSELIFSLFGVGVSAANTDPHG